MQSNDSNIMSFAEFCDRLIADGAYQSDDGHLHRKDGRPLSRQDRNGYYTVRKMYDNNNYCFMEHRVVYYMHNGKFDEELQINHKDFDRSNNRINNLELMTAKENVRYTIDAGRNVILSGPDNPKAVFSEKEVQLIRHLKSNGWLSKEIRKLFDNKTTETTINRVVEKTRYGSVLDAASISSLYPLIVDKTCRKDLSKKDAILNASLGLAGECGEVLDLIKKAFYQGADLDLIHLMLEIGDVIYYLYWLAMLFDIDISDIQFANMEKLNARYPEGFDTVKANNRAEGDV